LLSAVLWWSKEISNLTAQILRLFTARRTEALNFYKKALTSCNKESGKIKKPSKRGTVRRLKMY
jgi:hypothetical protein